MRINANKKKNVIFDSTNKYIHWLIFNNTLISKSPRFTPEPEILIDMIFDLKFVIEWDFTEIEKFKKEWDSSKKFRQLIIKSRNFFDLRI